MIGIIDYEMGNLHSVHKAFERIGAKVRIITTADEIEASDQIVLPGVGAFRDAIAALKQKGLVEPIRDSIKQGKPFLGICLGLQLLFDISYEDGEWEGLGIVKGRVVRFDFTGRPDEHELKIPHMGWNQLQWDRDVPIYRGSPDNPFVYFVHSYYVAPDDLSVAATMTDYGGEFVSSIWKDNVFAVQFHPEKSQQVGMKILENFNAI